MRCHELFTVRLLNASSLGNIRTHHSHAFARVWYRVFLFVLPHFTPLPHRREHSIHRSHEPLPHSIGCWDLPAEKNWKHMYLHAQTNGQRRYAMAHRRLCKSQHNGPTRSISASSEYASSAIMQSNFFRFNWNRRRTFIYGFGMHVHTTLAHDTTRPQRRQKVWTRNTCEQAYTHMCMCRFVCSSAVNEYYSLIQFSALHDVGVFVQISYLNSYPYNISWTYFLRSCDRTIPLCGVIHRLVACGVYMAGSFVHCVETIYTRIWPSVEDVKTTTFIMSWDAKGQTQKKIVIIEPLLCERARSICDVHVCRV